MRSTSNASFSLVNKNLHKTIFSLSIPGMVSSVLQTLYQLVDAYWVGQLGAEALAALGGTAFILWAIYSLSALSVNGISALVAQSIGAENPQAGRSAAGQGMMVNTTSALLIAVLVYASQQQLFTIMGFNSQVSFFAGRYLNITLSGLIFSFWFVGLEAVFRGLGDTRTPMAILAIALTVNAVLDPVFIFGWFGLPAMHIGGAALATISAQLLASLLAVVFLRKKEFIPTILKNRKWKFNVRLQRRILAIGSPIALGGFFFSLIYVVLTNIISRFGTEAIAAIGVCHRIEGIAWFACVGFSVAASTLVGQYVGANQIKQASRSARWVALYGVFTLLLVSIVFYFFPEWLMRIFTSNERVQKFGIEYLQIIAIFEIFLALEVIMEGAFSGAGYTLPVMLVTVPVTAVRVPLAWYLAIFLNAGTRGIWWAIALTTFLKGAINSLMFAAGLWKKRINAT